MKYLLCGDRIIHHCVTFDVGIKVIFERMFYFVLPLFFVCMVNARNY